MIKPLIALLAVVGGLTVLGSVLPWDSRTMFAGSAGAVEALRPSGAVLYEEDTKSPTGRRFIGTATWGNEIVTSGSGPGRYLTVRAEIEIPQRRMTMVWLLRHSSADRTLPASYAIQMLFTVPADFSAGGIAKVAGIVMKSAEQARGAMLPGISVRKANGSFFIDVPRSDLDAQLLQDSPWFDVPIYYTNGGRAVVAVEKGPAGDKAFADAFTAWEK